jgi:hypothetical protein
MALPWTCDRRVFFFFSFFFMLLLLLFVERKSRIAREKKKTLPSLPTDFPPLAVPFFFPQKNFSSIPFIQKQQLTRSAAKQNSGFLLF